MAIFDDTKPTEDRWIGVVCVIAAVVSAVFTGYFVIGLFPLAAGVVAITVGLAARLITCLSGIGGFAIAVAISERIRDRGDSMDMAYLCFVMAGSLIGLLLSLAAGTGLIATAIAVALIWSGVGAIIQYKCT
jgi:hypothetical protein